MSDAHFARIEATLEYLENRIAHLEVDVRSLKSGTQSVNTTVGFLKTAVERLKDDVLSLKIGKTNSPAAASRSRVDASVQGES